MPLFSSVLCAVDSSDVAEKVVRHAAVFAALGGGRLTLLTVTEGHRQEGEPRLERLLASAMPEGSAWLGEPRLRVARMTQGAVADAILEFAADADLIVLGTHARSGLSRWLLGSKSAAVLEQTTRPTLLIPPGTRTIVSISPEGPRLSPGAVIAAVDLDEHNDRQLQLAAALATSADQPLSLMTVAGPGVSDETAAAALAERARGLATSRPPHLVVSRGPVAEEIYRAAEQETAGLVVMGLRERGHGVAGEVATKVAHARDAVVLAVPA